ncbi:MAG: hypothetical protein ACKVOL_03675 [Novosphingobium sp.]
MYHLLFRSRWFALAWVLMMAASAVMFTTTGVGALLVGTAPAPSASADAEYRQNKFKAWAADEPMSVTGTDPSRPDKVRDGISRDDYRDSDYNSVPYSGAQNDSQQSGNNQ